MLDFPTAVGTALTQLHPSWQGEVGVVAVSGGADSVALLRALQVFNPPGGFVVAHLNHQLRGLESDGDEQFVRELAAKLGQPFETKRINIREAGGNLEATARTERYRWLANIASRRKAVWVATGHTANDQAETVLHRIIRGTGLAGLRGIAPSRVILPEDHSTSVRLLRPLLGLTRADVIAFLADLQQLFRTDSTNSDTALTRNRIRAELLPLLQSFNPAIVEVLHRLATQAEELAETQQADARTWLYEAELPRAGSVVVLQAEKLSKLGEIRVRALLRELWHREQWPANGMSFQHWRRAASFALGLQVAADFPSGVRARHVGSVVQFHRET